MCASVFLFSFYDKMGILGNIFGINKKDMYSSANYVGKDSSGNYIYLPKDAVSFFNNEKRFKTDYNFDSLAEIRAASIYCYPFALMLERCGKMIQNGKIYVTDNKGNEKRGFKEIADLLTVPNPYQSGKSFIKDIEFNLRAFGFCPIYLLRAFETDVPRCMSIIPPELFHIEGTGKLFMQFKKEDIIKRAYIDWGSNKTILQPFEYCVIVDSRMIIPNSEGTEIRFENIINSLSPHARNYMSQIIGRGNMIINGGPKGILYSNDGTEAGNAALDAKEAKNINDQFKKKYGIVNKLYEVMVTTKKVGWINIGSTTQQMMLHEEGEACINDFANAIGLSPDLFSQGATFDNKEAAKKAAYQDLIIPDSENIAQTLTEAICPDNAYIHFDFSHVSCLQEDLAKTANQLGSISNALSSLLGNKLITIEEARQELARYIDINPIEIPNINEQNKTNEDEQE